MVKKTEYKGTFEGYQDGAFLFRTADGILLKERKSGVRELKLGEPCSIGLVTSKKKDSEWVVLKQYKSMKFVIEDGDKEKKIYGNTFKKITIHHPDEGGGGGGVGLGMPELIDTSGVEARDDLTPAQTAALTQYKAAKAEWEQFLEESTALMKAADQVQDAKRMELMEKLRERKNEEMPIRTRLNGATKTLLAAFPDAE